ncbi:SDR family NAD(P)-dependent oxidoreductase [Streptomyces dubilierae]|uniref:SDR family NAD(P)-dependent oxidoreductase n=1 Tax=Streptomyces dubilierae TaxID=3075533 RepID=A0ABU2PIS8_9ACTN|nr:SDR family NAD(P)-dependent oxidoreductase [Streptomyces sp. DSM 41921]MDT0392067.1 SDR family NAD(P)-dependent oxidoreductase [Streptomyces sp. DSM 41921]
MTEPTAHRTPPGGPGAGVSPSRSLAPVGSRVLLESQPGATHTRAVRAAWERHGFHVEEADDAPGGGPPDVYCVVAVGNEAFGARPSAPLRRGRVARVLLAMARRGRGRAVLVTDAGPHVHAGAGPEAAAARAADQAWWQHLAKRCAPRGVAANTVRVGYAPFLGHVLSEQAENELLRHLVTRRPVEPAELAAALRVLASQGLGNVVGETLPLDGGLDATVVPMPSARAARPAHDPGPGVPDPFRLDGSVVLVTGASSGIGASIARECAARGADVVLAARRRPELEKLAAELREHGGRAWVVTADLSTPGQAAELVRRAWEHTGGLDALAHAAGAVTFDGPGDNTPHRERLLSLNTLSYASACDALLDRWAAAGRGGAVAAVSSLAAVSAPVANLASYGLSKAATTLYTHHFATSAARYGVRANTVLPGFVRTPMTDVTNPAFLRATNRLVPTGRMSEPDEVAALLCYLISPAAAGLTGAALRIDGGGHCLAGLPHLNPTTEGARP